MLEELPFTQLLQQWAAIPHSRRVATSLTLSHAMLPMSLVTAGCKPAYSVVTNRPTSAQHQQCGLHHTNPALVCSPLFLQFLLINRAPATFSCAFFPTNSFPCFRRLHVFTFWSANRALATILRTFCPELSQLEARTRETPEVTIPVRAQAAQGFVPESVFTREFLRSRTMTHKLLLLLLLLTWWRHDDDGDDDDDGRDDDGAFVRNSEVH